jgi:hypothetical protein
MKQYWLMSSLLLSIVFIVLPIPYIIRKPQPAQEVVKAASYEAVIAPQNIAAMDTKDRLILDDLITQADKEATPRKRFIRIEEINTIGTDNEYLNHVFSSISLNIFTILKQTVRIFDVLLPAVNVLHNYFVTLQNLSTGENKKVFIRLHKFFIRNLKGLARQYYGWAIWYKNRGFKKKELNMITLAQALLYRIKDEDAESLALYKELDTYQPVSFDKEVNLMGIVATGGSR